MAEKKKKSISAKDKLLSPNPKRVKFVTELLHAFANRKVSFSSLVNLESKKVKQIAEMGYIKLKHGRLPEAKQIFEILTLIDHRNYFHHLALASTYQKMNKPIDALYQYSETLKFDPKNINALVNRGEIYLRRKNYKKAAEDFREAILLDNTGSNRFANRARSLVIAIKRSLARDKELSQLKSGEKPQLPSDRKKISPLSIAPSKKK